MNSIISNKAHESTGPTDVFSGLQCVSPVEGSRERRAKWRLTLPSLCVQWPRVFILPSIVARARAGHMFSGFLPATNHRGNVTARKVKGSPVPTKSEIKLAGTSRSHFLSRRAVCFLAGWVWTRHWSVRVTGPWVLPVAIQPSS
jgi:hypothetical protein